MVSEGMDAPGNKIRKRSEEKELKHRQQYNTYLHYLLFLLHYLSDTN